MSEELGEWMGDKAGRLSGLGTESVEARDSWSPLEFIRALQGDVLLLHRSSLQVGEASQSPLPLRRGPVLAGDKHPMACGWSCCFQNEVSFVSPRWLL